tara:strand:- start:217 stop:333 length:117 start_codon:yes stop_codon:yes gene_type:complete
MTTDAFLFENGQNLRPEVSGAKVGICNNQQGSNDQTFA